MLEGRGSSLDRVLNLTLFRADGRPAVNPICAGCFGSHRPASSTVSVPTFRGRLEIEAVPLMST